MIELLESLERDAGFDMCHPDRQRDVDVADPGPSGLAMSLLKTSHLTNGEF